ncbi:Uncharacterised protein [Shigella sonnei]|nr:Uncharacterised protein [Shigella sonnei]
MVCIDLFVIPTAVAYIWIYHWLQQQIWCMNADGIHHRVASGKMFFWQIATIGTRISD